MKRFVKPFKIAFLVSFILNFGGVLVTYFYHGGWEEVKQDLVRIYPISIPIFFVPPFLSMMFFKKDKKFFFQFLKPAIFSFLIVSSVVFLNLYFKNNISKRLPFFPTVFNGIIAFFLSVFFTIIEFVKEKKSLKISKIEIKIRYKLSVLFLIPFVASVIYAIIFYVSYNSINAGRGNTFLLLKLLFPGIIVAFISMLMFNFLYRNSKAERRKIQLIIFYIVSVLFFPIIYYLDFYFNASSSLINNPKFNFVDKLFINLTILSPYYLFIISFSHLYFLQLLNQQEKEAIQQESLESQLNYQQLKAQLSPHFLFNNINVLTSLIEENPKKAVQFSEKLANIYRYFLEQEKQDVVLLQDEITFAKDYLQLLQTRFENGLSFTIDIEKSSEEKYIVATTLQQVLENVIKHNEVSKEHPVKISIQTKDDYLWITNNKNPKKTTLNELGKGIENSKKRYTYFSDKEIVVSNNVRFFTIQLPLLNQ